MPGNITAQGYVFAIGVRKRSVFRAQLLDLETESSSDTCNHIVIWLDITLNWVDIFNKGSCCSTLRELSLPGSDVSELSATFGFPARSVGLL